MLSDVIMMPFITALCDLTALCNFFATMATSWLAWKVSQMAGVNLYGARRTEHGVTLHHSAFQQIFPVRWTEHVLVEKPRRADVSC